MSTTSPPSSQEAGTDVSHLTPELGEIPGAGCDWLMLESQLIRHWNKKQLQVEVARGQGAWFDYRTLHPALRSHVFWHEYRRARERASQRFYGKPDERAPSLDLYHRRRNKAQISTILNLMHLADEMCLPYGHFFDGVFEDLMQNRGYATVWNREGVLAEMKLPALSHMQKGESLTHARARFDRVNLRKAYLPRHPLYLARNWAGLPAQRDFVTWAFREARRREGNFHYALRALVDRGYIHEREILRSFGPDVVKCVRAIDE